MVVYLCLCLMFKTANGCADFVAPANAWVGRFNDRIVVRCNFSQETWYMTCKGTEWIGEVTNCTDSKYTDVRLNHQTSSDHRFDRQWSHRPLLDIFGPSLWRLASHHPIQDTKFRLPTMNHSIEVGDLTDTFTFSGRPAMRLFERGIRH